VALRGEARWVSCDWPQVRAQHPAPVTQPQGFLPPISGGGERAPGTWLGSDGDHRKTEANQFFMQELVQALFEQRVLVRKRRAEAHKMALPSSSDVGLTDWSAGTYT
jgi:hypothetical protein